MSAQPAATQSEIMRGSSDCGQRRQAGMSAITPPARATRRNGVLVFEHQESQLPELWKKGIRALMIQCCEQYPSISVDEDVLGGVPHIRDSRVSVDYVLDGIYVLGSIKSVARKYSHITETQVRDAVGYAQTFMELVCEPYQADD